MGMTNEIKPKTFVEHVEQAQALVDKYSALIVALGMNPDYLKVPAHTAMLFQDLYWAVGSWCSKLSRENRVDQGVLHGAQTMLEEAAALQGVVYDEQVEEVVNLGLLPEWCLMTIFQIYPKSPSFWGGHNIGRFDQIPDWTTAEQIESSLAYHGRRVRT